MTAGDDRNRSDKVLAAEYALGVLPHAERAVFAARLEHDAALRAEVRLWEERLLPLADEITAETPPPRVLEIAERRLFGAAPARGGGWWNSIGLWRGLAVVSAAAAVALGVIAWHAGNTPPVPGAAYMAELRGDGGTLSLMALYDERTGTLRLNRTAGSAEVNRVFQLWLISERSDPVPLGLLPREAQAGSIAIPEGLRGAIGDGTLAISDEPEGGSPTGLPTGPVLALGQLSPI